MRKAIRSDEKRPSVEGLQGSACNDLASGRILQCRPRPIPFIAVRGMSLSYLAIAFIVFAAVAAVAVQRRRRSMAERAIDPGAVSQQWLAESRREEEA